MKQLQILGTGCPNCQRLAAATQEAMQNLGLELELVKIEDLESIIAFGVLRTPALAVDGEVRVSGRVPSVREIEGIIAG